MAEAMECAAGGGVRGWTKEWRARSGLVAGDGALSARVMRARGITGEAGAAFLEPSLRQLHDPSLMPDLDRAAERLLAAARAREPIVIYGDYDVDGVTATAILYHMLRAVAPECVVRTYVPHRLEEGYGLNAEAIRELARGGARVIVSVDCGVTARGPAEAAREAGVDLIITDHHHVSSREEELPRAYAVVHPRRAGSRYPFGELCGAGVAYKVAWRLATMASGSERVSEGLRVLLVEMLALASLGVIADVVPLLGENRVIAKFGLGRIRNSPLPGMRELVRESGLAGEKVEAEDVGFRLGPRLNACGRLGHAREAVELLTTARGERAVEIARMLGSLNRERQETERAIFEQAAAMAEREGMTGEGRRAIVLASEGWHAGVVGIVCARLVERYHRPAILMSVTEGVCHGSGRSVEGFSLHGALTECAGHLTTFGGHEMAAGLKLPREGLGAFVEALTAVANREIGVERLVGRVEYDCEAGVEELERSEVEALTRLGPFGRENPEVRVRLRGVRVMGRAEVFGGQSRHLAVRVSPVRGGGRPVRLVAWGWGERARDVPSGAAVEAVVTPGVSSFNGMVEGKVADLRVVGG